MRTVQIVVWYHWYGSIAFACDLSVDPPRKPLETPGYTARLTDDSDWSRHPQIVNDCSVCPIDTVSIDLLSCWFPKCLIHRANKVILESSKIMVEDVISRH